MTSSYYLGIDGGGTKTHAVIADSEGRIIAMSAAGPTNPEWVGFEARDGLAAITTELLTSGGIKPTEIASAYLGMAGVNSDAPDDEIRKLFLDGLEDAGIPKECAIVDNDAFAGMASAIDTKPGVAVVCGTGFTAVGKGRNGERCRVPWYVAGRSAGHILGKQAALSAVFDLTGAGTKTLLTQMVLELFELGGVEDLLNWMLKFPGNEVVRITPLIAKAADAGDPVAIDMLYTAGMELGLAAVLVAKSIGFSSGSSPCPVVTIGGVFNAGKWIKEPIAKVLEGSNIQATLYAPKCLPVAGAVILAWEKAGLMITEDMKKNLTEGLMC